MGGVVRAGLKVCSEHGYNPAFMRNDKMPRSDSCEATAPDEYRENVNRGVDFGLRAEILEGLYNGLILLRHDGLKGIWHANRGDYDKL